LDRLKWSVQHSRNGVWGDESRGDETDLPCVRVADFDRTRLRVSADVPTIRSVPISERKGRILSRGNLLIEKSGGGEKQPVGTVVLYVDDRPAVCSNFIAKLQLAPEMEPFFWCYVHAAAYSTHLTTASIKQTSGIQNLDQQAYFDEYVAFPPLDEQRAIAAFLDRETAKIDALIAEQERLIALLQEKRQAVISQAVTKGLDPTVPMKDSGSRWIGLIPENWSVGILKHVVSHVVDCLHTTPHYDGDLQYPAIRTADIERGRLLIEQTRRVSAEVYEERIQRLRPVHNDIVYSREGERFGMAALVPAEPLVCLGQRVMMFRAVPDVDPVYLMWVLNSDSVYQQVVAGLGGATSPHVNISDIINFRIAVPSFEEQQRIGTEISKEVRGIDRLISEVTTAIDLLTERRAALISAAVTGKIDVREAGAKPAEAA
jgi:type I restriction enzyme S subunit